MIGARTARSVTQFAQHIAHNSVPRVDVTAPSQNVVMII